jgi:hypothetical protein
MRFSRLVLLLVSFAVAGAATVGWFQRSFDVGAVLVWFGAAIVVHDLVLLPAYSVVDRAVAGFVGRLVAFVRVPLILSGLLLIVFFPLIFRVGSGTYRAASGQDVGAYLGRWLIATAVLFLGSGLVWAARALVTRRRGAGRGQTPPSPS